jgi:ABC-type sugar transport system, periplasmic component
MKREKIFNTIGLTLLAACFLFSLARVVRRGEAAADGTVDGRAVVRFAHWQLEGGLREAMDRLARDYEAVNPNVRVEQIAVPERTYKQWVRTQLIGGTAPEIVQLGQGADDELLARFIMPISEWVDKPNPYNAGTDLENTPWRETFVDNMEAGWNYRPNLAEYYGASMSMFTVRIFYNRDLWRRLLGDTPVPKTYDEFIEICERVRSASETTGRVVLPIAGSRENGSMLAFRLFSTQTQRLVRELDREHTLRPENIDVALAFLRGEWSVDSRGYHDGLAIMRETGLHMQPGFIQLRRDDAAFYFLQERAMMIATGSWDAPSFRAQADFEIGVFAIPAPSRDHPRYGANVLGQVSEANTGTGLSFGIVQGAARSDLALDFLHFATSRANNETFAQVSGWLPSVVGVNPTELIEPFVPVADGYLGGFDPTLSMLGANTLLTVQRSLNRLVDRAGSVASFTEIMREQLPDALREDLGRYERSTLLNVQRQDVILAALAMHGGAAMLSNQTGKLSEMLEAQNRAESRREWVLEHLADGR